jgi:hypothetical protein
VPALTFRTVRASPSAAQILAAILGSVRRVVGYVLPMASYGCVARIGVLLVISSSIARRSADQPAETGSSLDAHGPKNGGVVPTTP